MALAACSSGSHDYPSLAIREAERAFGTFTVPAGDAVPIRPASAPPAVIESLPEQIALADAAHQRFLSMSSETERLVMASQGSNPYSNAWAAAQVALAELESQRSQSAIALGTLDLLYADASLAFTEREQVDAARSRVLEMVKVEDDVLAQLRGATPD